MSTTSLWLINQPACKATGLQGWAEVFGPKAKETRHSMKLEVPSFFTLLQKLSKNQQKFPGKVISYVEFTKKVLYTHHLYWWNQAHPKSLLLQSSNSSAVIYKLWWCQRWSLLCFKIGQYDCAVQLTSCTKKTQARSMKHIFSGHKYFFNLTWLFPRHPQSVETWFIFFLQNLGKSHHI